MKIITVSGTANTRSVSTVRRQSCRQNTCAMLLWD